MEISIKSCLSGAKSAEGVTVIIDVFRSSNTIIACLIQGAECIFPVAFVEEALRLKKAHPDYLLFGERKGQAPVGFDGDNSPAKASGLKIDKKQIILTTSVGTKGIMGAERSEEILIGSFANAGAIISYLRKTNPKKVSLIAIGLDAEKTAAEDDLCAAYIKQNLEGKTPDFKKITDQILKSAGASRLRKLKQEDDLDFCLKLDITNIIPKFNRHSGKITMFRQQSCQKVLNYNDS